MSEKIEEPEEDLEEEEAEAELEEAEAELPATEQVESSWEDLVAKRAEAADEDDEESLFDLSPEERVETLSVRAIPPQSNEFICTNCRLVKHQSQMADRKKVLCRDCV